MRKKTGDRKVARSVSDFLFSVSLPPHLRKDRLFHP
jgi:hypothetical protein